MRDLRLTDAFVFWVRCPKNFTVGQCRFAYHHFITGHGDVEQCAVAFKNGAVDFLTKPIDERALLKAIDTALQRSIEKHRQEAAHQEVRN